MELDQQGAAGLGLAVRAAGGDPRHPSAAAPGTLAVRDGTRHHRWWRRLSGPGRRGRALRDHFGHFAERYGQPGFRAGGSRSGGVEPDGVRGFLLGAAAVLRGRSIGLPDWRLRSFLLAPPGTVAGVLRDSGGCRGVGASRGHDHPGGAEADGQAGEDRLRPFGGGDRARGCDNRAGGRRRDRPSGLPRGTADQLPGRSGRTVHLGRHLEDRCPGDCGESPRCGVGIFGRGGLGSEVRGGYLQCLGHAGGEPGRGVWGSGERVHRPDRVRQAGRLAGDRGQFRGTFAGHRPQRHGVSAKGRSAPGRGEGCLLSVHAMGPFPGRRHQYQQRFRLELRRYAPGERLRDFELGGFEKLLARASALRPRFFGAGRRRCAAGRSGDRAAGGKLGARPGRDR